MCGSIKICFLSDNEWFWKLAFFPLPELLRRSSGTRLGTGWCDSGPEAHPCHGPFLPRPLSCGEGRRELPHAPRSLARLRGAEAPDGPGGPRRERRDLRAKARALSWGRLAALARGQQTPRPAGSSFLAAESFLVLAPQALCLRFPPLWKQSILGAGILLGRPVRQLR